MLLYKNIFKTISLCVLLLFFLIEGKSQNTNLPDSLTIALKNYQEKGKKAEEGRCLLEIGSFFQRNNNYERAEIYFSKALNCFQAINQEQNIADALTAISYCNRILGNFDKGLEIIFNALDIYEKIGDLKGQARAFRDIGSIYYYYSEFDKALEYYEKSYKLYKKQNDKNGIANSLNNIGIIYRNIGKEYEAIKYYTQAYNLKIRIGELKSASNTLYNLGMVYQELNEFDKALEYFFNSYYIMKSANDRFKIANTQNSIAQIYIEKNKYKLAKSYLDSALLISKKIAAKNLIQEVYHTYSKLYKKQSDYSSALEYYKLHVFYKDSVFNSKSRKVMAQYQSKFETEHKNKEIEQKEKEIRLAEIGKQKAQRNFIIVFAIIIILLIFVLYSRNLIWRKTNVLLTEKNSELQRINQNLQLAKEKAEVSDKLKTAFLSNMSHEIRNPMNTIVGFANLLPEPDLPKSEKITYVNHIIESGNNLLSLIHDIVDISKIEAEQQEIKKENCYVNKTLDQLYHMFEREKHKKGLFDIQLVLKKEVDDEFFVIKTDPDKFRAIFKNLIKNAFRFTNQGFIEFGYTVSNHKNTIQFYVQDTGKGISQKQQRIIFERFNKIEEGATKIYEGTGLGLIISKKMVHLLGGTIHVESIPKRGSTFYFTLPFETGIVPKPATETEQEICYDNFNWGSKLILIAEDEKANFRFLETVLKLTGAKIIWVQNGKEAIDKCHQNALIDLVLMDIKMPVMGGYDATKAIKKIRPELPIIAQTAFAMSGDKEKALEAGCTDYIAKPISPDNLISTVSKYI